MGNWRDIRDQKEAHTKFAQIAKAIQTGELNLGRRHYAHSVAIGVFESILCGCESLSVIELGISQGGGVLDLCKSAAYFRDAFEIDIQVFGFDTTTGLPPPDDFRDHPEMWKQGQFRLKDFETLKKNLPSFARLVIGDVGDTVPHFESELSRSPLGFAAVDVDYYSSTTRLMPLFKFKPTCYLPAVPLYFDDIELSLTWNSWCGEALAIREFNDENEFRKIEAKSSFKIRFFHALQVLDHPLRTGERKFRDGFPIMVMPLF